MYGTGEACETKVIVDHTSRILKTYVARMHSSSWGQQPSWHHRASWNV